MTRPKITGQLSPLKREVLVQLFPSHDPDMLMHSTNNVDMLVGTDYFCLHPKQEVARAGENLSIMKGELGVCLVGTHTLLKECTVLSNDVPKTLHPSERLQHKKSTFHVTIQGEHPTFAKAESFIGDEELLIDSTPKCGEHECAKCPLSGHRLVNKLSDKLQAEEEIKIECTHKKESLEANHMSLTKELKEKLQDSCEFARVQEVFLTELSRKLQSTEERLDVMSNKYEVINAELTKTKQWSKDVANEKEILCETLLATVNDLTERLLKTNQKCKEIFNEKEDVQANLEARICDLQQQMDVAAANYKQEVDVVYTSFAEQRELTQEFRCPNVEFNSITTKQVESDGTLRPADSPWPDGAVELMVKNTKQRDLKVNDVVLVPDTSTLKREYRSAIVIATHPGKDGKVCKQNHIKLQNWRKGK